MRKWIILLSVVMVFAVALPAFAAVQNVKVSGDITLRGLMRRNMTLGGSSGSVLQGDTDTYDGARFGIVGDTDGASSNQDWFMSTVRLRVDADLTDNVSGRVELMNQRDIDPPYYEEGSQYTDPNMIYPAAGQGQNPRTAANQQYQVILSEAYIQAKEFFYDPLTITAGRQKIQFGDGFVVGANQLTGPDPTESLTADEFSAFTGFDAIRAQFDWAPYSLDMFYAKIKEGIVDRNDDTNAFGVNFSREWDVYSAEADVYVVGLIDNAIYSHPLQGLNNLGSRVLDNGRARLEGTEQVYAIGTRGSIKPFDRLKLNGELVFEFGEEAYEIASPMGYYFVNGTRTQDICAFATDLRGEYLVNEVPWPVTVGGEYVMYSGEDRSEKGDSGAYRPMFRGKFHSAIREYQGWFYHLDLSTTPGYTNEHQAMIDATFHPFNNPDVTVFSRYLNFWLFAQPSPGRDYHLGQEVDLKLSYDYTEDLTLSLLGAWFFPGAYFEATDSPVANIDNLANTNVLSGVDEAKHDNITEIVGSVKLSF
ncbi:MAG: alginate export family protein [Candidatus Omnitrophica bacterium]|nr:alginate export family protein [Candidatus Omnitrophota bacterium]